MILDKEEVDARLVNPDNLLNRLRLLTKPKVDIISIPSNVQHPEPSSGQHPSLPPSIDELVDNLQDKVNTAKCYSGAKDVLATAIDQLKTRIVEVDNPNQLSRIATDMSKIVNGFDENKKEKVSVTIPIIYRPLMMSESSFQVINVNE